MLDGARGMPLGRKSAGTYVFFACGGRFGAREDNKLHKLMGACIRNCYHSKEFRVRKRQSLTNRCHRGYDGPFILKILRKRRREA